MSRQVPGPWTQSIRVGWRPELNFYENRTQILRGFEQEGSLRAFHFSENEVAAQLFDSRDRLSVRQDGLTLDLDDPTADLERAWRALEQAFETVNPQYPRTIRAGFRHLVPLELSLAEAIARSYGTVLGRVGSPAIRFGDFALLADIALGGDPSAPGQIEFGVVTREEAPARLSGTVRGRSQVGEVHPGIASDPELFPEVGLFSYLWVSRSLGTGTSFLQGARAFWGRARQEADDLVGSLQTMFTSADNEEKNTG